ncbi:MULTISPECIES: hypothetical protein [unclassified Paenibacillus]|uniref:hypothetical protein n=1 Tax=unclassified Paenibacillus TaxID=185978 RepID=UPI001AE1F693|nr:MULTISPECIES: hypothetical protein [unclassified Paenibacillus]MBP1155100.1 MFS family permease [Paenibacillus sp. PvP091]MBP1169516.1 MFS family permease [Paenibacillus sp. PvR098]MBP2440544.1 MFS family permease [Paenibacillus sp. PvP052]
MNPLISLTIIKIVISVVIVFVLAEISKRVNPQIAGMISGIPLGTGLSIYFITMEQGMDFTLSGIPWGIAGLAAALIFCLVYLLISRTLTFNSKLIEILISSAAGIIAFVMIGSLIFLMDIDVALASSIFILVFIINLILMNKLIGKQEKSTGSKSKGIHYFIRGITVGMILVLITGMASLVGSKWANILSSFPSTLFPLIVVLHYEDDHRLFPYVIYGFSYSIATLFVFYIAYAYLIPIYGLNMGYFIIYVICAAFLYLFQKLRVGFGLIR